MASSVVSCRWDWCRSTFPTIDALDTHVKHAHIWPMTPMRKTEIALMRRMDLQSLHSSPNTESSTIPRGPVAGVPRDNISLDSLPTAPPSPISETHQRSENDEFETFTQLSSPPQTQSPPTLPTSPVFEGLVRQNGHSGLSAAVEIFERTHGHKANRHHRSAPNRPHSSSSGSSQEVVEQQLTQEDDVGSQPQPLLPLSELQTEDELVDTELRWPTADEAKNMLASEEIRNSEQLMPEQNPLQDSTPDSTRGQNFHCGSLDVILDTNGQGASPPTSSGAPHDSEVSQSQSQPIVLQTQAPYSSQAMDWSQTQ